ncbi:MAG: hypothetical protein JWP78_1517 [Mucilaginibacter sp.]|nr:hypothetical protein [Mucilaginibacter sp.]
MKNIGEKDQIKQVAKRPAKHVQHKSEELKTDPPISEKDEIKKAEETLREVQKKRL